MKTLTLSCGAVLLIDDSVAVVDITTVSSPAKVLLLTAKAPATVECGQTPARAGCSLCPGQTAG